MTKLCRESVSQVVLRGLAYDSYLNRGLLSLQGMLLLKTVLLLVMMIVSGVVMEVTASHGFPN